MRNIIKRIFALLSVIIITLLLISTLYLAFFSDNQNLLLLLIVLDILFPIFLYVFLNIAKAFKDKKE